MVKGLAALSAFAVFATTVSGQSAGTVQAVYDLIERVLPGSSSQFALSMVSSCPGGTAGHACYTIADSGAQVAIGGTTANEIAAGLGHYLRDVCNMTIGWPRGGGNNIFKPAGK